MRLLHLTAGTGSWHCGTCIRDDALVQAWQAAGHEARLIPMYLPIVADGPGCSAGEPVRFSGVSAYLQQELAAFRSLPDWVDAPLAWRPLLALAGRFSGSTDPASLGAMTVSMLQGEDGHQAREIRRLAHQLARGPRPEAIVLSNSLLGGLIPCLRRTLGAPVVTTLQGELHFLDALDTGRDEAWSLVREALQASDALVAVSAAAADAWADRTGIDRGRIDVVPNGVDTRTFGPPLPPEVPTIGHLARLSDTKGVGLLTDAWLSLKAQGHPARLVLGGTVTGEDRAVVDAARARIEAAGHSAHLTVHPAMAPEHKRERLRRLSVASVNPRKDDTGALYALEAMASGVPLVGPDRGALAEWVRAGNAGVLVRPDDPDALADALADLLADPSRALRLGDQGRQAARRRFDVAHMAAAEVEVIARVVADRRADVTSPLARAG